MAAKRRLDIDPAEIARLAGIRVAAVAVYSEALDLGPDSSKDVLGAIAWRSVFPEPVPFCPVLRDLINQARDERKTWREIATAMGEPEREMPVQSRQVWRNSKGLVDG